MNMVHLKMNNSKIAYYEIQKIREKKQFYFKNKRRTNNYLLASFFMIDFTSGVLSWSSNNSWKSLAFSI